MIYFDYNYALINEVGVVINATSSNNPEVQPLPENDEQYVVEVDKEDMPDIIGKFYNLETDEFEPYHYYKLVLQTQPPYQTGTVVLEFQQQTYYDEPVAVPTVFVVQIRDEQYTLDVLGGTLELTLECPEPTRVDISIVGERHEPCEIGVDVV